VNCLISLAQQVRIQICLLLICQDSFEIPVQVNVPGQPLPLPVKVRLQATTSDIILGPKTLDFGRVPLTECSGVYITISNPSALPQCFSFGAKLPMGLRLSPYSGAAGGSPFNADKQPGSQCCNLLLSHVCHGRGLESHHLCPFMRQWGWLHVTQLDLTHACTWTYAAYRLFTSCALHSLYVCRGCAAGYGRVLPHQSVKVLATFQPPIPGLQYFDIGCRTLSGRLFKLEGKCDGLQPEVTLSHNVIKVCRCFQ
jgi:hypothetical protein